MLDKYIHLCKYHNKVMDIPIAPYQVSVVFSCMYDLGPGHTSTVTQLATRLCQNAFTRHVSFFDLTDYVFTVLFPHCLVDPSSC